MDFRIFSNKNWGEVLNLAGDILSGIGYGTRRYIYDPWTNSPILKENV